MYPPFFCFSRGESMAKTKKAALYARVSTDFQFEEGYSIEAQVEKLQAYCKIKEIEQYEVYIDGGWSGSNIDRPELRRMMSDITSGKIDTVIVYKLDRLSRSQKDTIFLLEDVFEPNGCDFISINENFDTTSPYGKAMIGILSVFAQLERENIRERTRMGMHERVKSGLWMGGDGIPFGYDYDREHGVLVPNEHADDVRKIFDLYIRGYSTTKIAKMFDVASDRHVTMILDRKTYLGKIVYNGEEFEGRHEPLVSQEIFDAAQKARAERSTKSVVTSNYLLTGFLVCGKCGAKMRYQKWGKSLKIYCYSQQTSKTILIKDPNCDNDKHDAEMIEQFVVNAIFQKFRTTIGDVKKISPGENVVDTLKERSKAISLKIKKLYNLYASSENELLLDTIKDNQEELAQINRMIEDESSKKSTMTTKSMVEDVSRNIENLWPTLNVHERRSALRLLIKDVTIYKDRIDIHYI